MLPIEEDVSGTMRQIADNMEKYIGKNNYGFSILVFPFSGDIREAHYISNCCREDMIKALREKVNVLENEMPYCKHKLECVKFGDESIRCHQDISEVRKCFTQKFKVEYDNDSRGGSFSEWWSISNDNCSVSCNTEEDAERVCKLLNEDLKND